MGKVATPPRAVLKRENGNGNGKKKTKVTVRYDVGFKNNLYIRGSAAGLSWDRGVLLQNKGADEWVWETSAVFSKCEFKVLINDKQYEAGENHKISSGESIQYKPKF